MHLKLTCGRRQALGRMRKARPKCLLPLEDRGEAKRTEIKALVPHGTCYKDIVWKETVSAWLSLGEGVGCYPLTVLASWAEQDVGRGQENGKWPVVSMWGSSGQTRGAWLLPTLTPNPHRPRRHWGQAGFSVSPRLSIKRVYPSRVW